MRWFWRLVHHFRGRHIIEPERRWDGTERCATCGTIYRQTGMHWD